MRCVFIENLPFPTCRVNFLCDHPLVKAISFVGGDIAGKHIYDRAGRNGKRVQVNMGAKSV
jgi:malonate-semialdehyde dehydrogenase (acetylating)/methylmalonate-semialdehyde dehydrogenase